MSRLLSLLLLCSAMLAVNARELQAVNYKNLYAAVTGMGLTDLQQAIDAAGLKPYFSNGKNKVTLFAPSAAAWAYFYSECKNPKKGLVDLAFACNKEQLVSNKARLAAFIKYHVLASVVPAKYTPPPPGKALAQNWNKGPSFTKIDTIVGAGIFIRCRYTEATQTYEAHGTGRDGFILKAAGMSNVKAGAGLLHVVDNVITRDPRELKLV